MKELLKKIGEETIYSAKGHFKACDIRRNLVTVTIWLCAAINAFGMAFVETGYDRLLAAVGLFGTIALLIWNEGDGRNYKEKHKKTGESYLEVHKEARELFFREELSEDDLRLLNQRLRELDNSEKPDIPFAARKLAQWAIEKYDETNNWFL